MFTDKVDPYPQVLVETVMVPEHYTGSFCPVCDSDYIEPGEYEIMDPGEVQIETVCAHCGSSWWERYRLQGYKSLRINYDLVAFRE